MSTDDMLYFGDITLGVDGYQDVESFEADECCTDTLCVDTATLACSYLDILPEGPMWDKPKSDMRRLIQECGKIPSIDNECEMPECASMVLYAVYAAQVLSDFLNDILLPTIRESEPHTAVDTLDDWLDQLNWVDCYRSPCRSQFLANKSPYEQDDLTCMTSSFDDLVFPAPFEAALKHAILISLVRAQRGVIKNLDGLNWVIAPLGVEVQPVYTDEVQSYIDGDCDVDPENDPPCWCEEARITIEPVSETLPMAPNSSLMCYGPPLENTVEARQTYTRDGRQCWIYPGQLAAECIVLGLLPINAI